MKKKTMMGKLSSLLFALALVWGGVSCTPPQAPVDPTMYTITFDSNGGSEVAAKKVEENVAATAPEEPTKDGYDFVEWLSGETAYDWTAPVTGDLTLTAKWAVEKYTIDYKLPEGSTNESNLVEYTIESETISELKDPKLPEGFTFLGWYTDENCTEEFVSIEKGSTGDVVIYAKYTDKQTFTVTYYIGDKANTKLEEKDAVFTLTGYDLFTDKECTKAYKDPITSDTILYAKVKKMTVKFDSNGGSAVEEAKVDYNTAVAKPTDPTLDGSTFQGWTLDGKAYDFNSKVTKDITLKATWKANAAEEPEDPTTPTIPTTVVVTKNDDGSFSFADGTYTFVLEGDNPVLKFSMPEDVPCTVGDKLKLTGSIDFGEEKIYQQFYIQTSDAPNTPIFTYNMINDFSYTAEDDGSEHEGGLSGVKKISISQEIMEKISNVEFCTSFKDCRFVLGAPLSDKKIINVKFEGVKLIYEKFDPNANLKIDLEGKTAKNQTAFTKAYDGFATKFDAVDISGYSELKIEAKFFDEENNEIGTTYGLGQFLLLKNPDGDWKTETVATQYNLGMQQMDLSSFEESLKVSGIAFQNSDVKVKFIEILSIEFVK